VTWDIDLRHHMDAAEASIPESEREKRMTPPSENCLESARKKTVRYPAAWFVKRGEAIHPVTKFMAEKRVPPQDCQ
jgi:hypothetical protein